MKKLLCLAIVFTALEVCQNSIVNAQGVGINPSGNSPDSSAGLDVNFTNKGMLIPRVSLSSTTDLITIPSPSTYLTVYNTNAAMTNGNGAGMYYYDGSKWVYMAAASNGPGTSGQVLTSQGNGNPPQWQAAGGGATHGKQTFTTTGNFIVPDGVTTVWVSMCGGGGSGGFYGPGGGGGGGANALSLPVTVTPAATILVTVGAGGAGVTGPTNGNGNPGGTSSFGSYITAGGGGAGKGTSAPNGGAGGTGSAGTIPGCPGYTFGNYMNWGAAGGNSLFGFGGVATSTQGVSGIGYGSGGSGSANTGTTTGSGRPGIVIVEW